MNDTRLYLDKVVLFEGLSHPGRASGTRKNARTLEVRLIGSLYVHLLDSDLSSLSCINTHHLVISSNKDTSLSFFENVSGSFYPLSNRPVKMKRCHQYKADVNAKCLVLATAHPCVLDVCVVPRRLEDELSSDFSVVDGVIVTNLPEEERQQVVSNLQSNALSLPLSSLIPAEPKTIRFTTLRYYLELTTAVTITDKVEEIYRYSPFSVKSVNGAPVQLLYSVRMKTAAGNAAVVKVSCIEGISYNAYSVLKTPTGEELTATHTGQIAAGTFNLPAGIVDVGLLFSTPYGFKGDLHDNPDTDLFSFDTFQLIIA